MNRTLSAAVLTAIFVLARQPLALAAPTTSVGYVSDAQNGRVLAVNLSTGASHVVGSFGSVVNIGGLAYDTLRKTLFGVSPSTDALYSINLATGAATIVGGFGVGGIVMQGAAYDPTSNQLFATASSSGELFTINPDTGQAQLVGSFSEAISGLAVNPLTGDLYGSPPAAFTDDAGLFLINKTTAALTLIGTTTIGYNGLAFDADGTLYGVQNTTDSIYRIDVATATRTLIGPLGVAGVNPLGFEIVAVPEPAGMLISLAAIFGAAAVVGRLRREKREAACARQSLRGPARRS